MGRLGFSFAHENVLPHKCGRTVCKKRRQEAFCCYNALSDEQVAYCSRRSSVSTPLLKVTARNLYCTEPINLRKLTVGGKLEL